MPPHSFSSFRHRARSWSHQRRICYKAEHTAAGTNLRFLITNCPSLGLGCLRFNTVSCWRRAQSKIVKHQAAMGTKGSNDDTTPQDKQVEHEARSSQAVGSPSFSYC